MFKTFVYSLQDSGLEFDGSHDIHGLSVIESAFVSEIDEAWDRIARPDDYIVTGASKRPLQNRLDKLQMYQLMRNMQLQRTKIIENARTTLERIRSDLHDRIHKIKLLEKSVLEIDAIGKAEGFLYVKLLKYESLTRKIIERNVQIHALQYQCNAQSEEGDEEVKKQLHKQIRNHQRSVNRWKIQRRMILESY